MIRRLFLLLILPFISYSQNQAVGTSEKLVYSASYNISGLLTEIAQVTMETSMVKTSSSTLLRLKCAAATYSSFDSYFKIRDLYESYVSPTSLKPYLYKRDINEGTYNKFEQYKFSYKTNTVESITRKRRPTGNTEVKNTVKFGPNTADIVATIYQLRNIEFRYFKPGQTKSLSFLFDNKPMSITIKYLGKESIGSKLGKKECYKLAIALNNSNLLKGSADNLLWLSADKSRIPVYARFKIPVGNGELKIKSATGLKS
ncbi:MAG: hypothetical protein RLZZ241_1721 [Bacteroidota bacterium]|jgi:hypothetical protein